jgi:hypothetical protein
VSGRTIKVLPDTDIVEVRYAGEITYRSRIATLEELERMLPDGGLHRLLINYTSAWPASERDGPAVAEFGAKLGRVPFARGARIALVNAPLDLDSQTATVSTHAGFSFRQFHERALAIEWLSETA